MLQRLLSSWRLRFLVRAHPQLRWLHLPATVTDPAAWDAYWRDQIAAGGIALRWVDSFCNDGRLVDAMRADRLRTILCVGSGTSQEPRALAAAGFDVTALDLSPFAIEAAKQTEAPPDVLRRLIGGRSLEAGGQLNFVVGDLRDPTVCPGPFDVVIERRTLQLFVWRRAKALRAVANRLGARGILFCHAHDGRWRPPAPRRHPCEDWFAAHGWQRWTADSPVSGRVVWLFITTG